MSSRSGTEEQAGETMWRCEPDVSPSAVGMDARILHRIAAMFSEAVGQDGLFEGAQLAIYRDGRRVLDIGGGLARPRLAAPVTPATLFVSFSCTKGLTALAMCMLRERGRFSFDDPVITYWPSFASLVPEKRRITIGHVLSHRAGLPSGPAWLTPRHWRDRDAIRRAMEEVPLQWTPGEAYGYHALNYGWILNELMQRLDPQGRDVGHFLAEEVFEPLAIADIYLGLPDDEVIENRVAWCSIAGDRPPATPVSEAAGIAPELHHPFNRPAVHQAVIPAAGGTATARALAKFYAVLAAGGALGGVRVIERASLAAAITPTTREGERDRLTGAPTRWGMGWHVGNMGEGSSELSFGHEGAGGQMAFADLSQRLAFAFTTTRAYDEERCVQWRTEVQGMAFRACND